jgi:urate oxidase
MGEAVLNSFDRIREIYLSLPNKHFTPVNLAPFGMDNSGEVFLPTDEPHGLIEATLRKE